MKVVTVYLYKKDKIAPVDPETLMAQMWTELREHGHRCNGSYTRFECVHPTSGDTLVFEVQDKREVY